MSESTGKGNSKIQESINPNVCVGSSGPKRDMNCDYDNVTFMFSEELGIPVTEMFNSFVHKSNFDIFVYMSKDYDFIDNKSLSNLVNELWSDDMADIGAMYSNICAKINNRVTMLKPYPTAHRNMINSSSMTNIPFAAKSSIAPMFRNDFKILFLHDGLNSLFSQTLVFNTTNSYFCINNFNESSPEISKELELLKNG